MNTTHDPAVVKIAELSRLFDSWMDASDRERIYLAWIAASDHPIEHERARELYLETAAAKARWLEATK
jgi:DNA-binding CsgD family transcriptional regulator